MKGFWDGFEKRAASPFLATGLSRVMGAIKPSITAAGRHAQHLKDIATMKSQSLAAQGASPAFKAMRAASIATLGTGGAFYGLNRLAHSDVHQVPQPQQY